MPTPHALSKISFILLIENNPFTKQSNFRSATMSNLVIPLLVLIHTRIINKHGSMPFSFKIIKVSTPGYYLSIIPSRLQTYQIGSFNGGITLVVFMK
jgi:hypothetical protein